MIRSLDAFDGIEKELSAEGLFNLALWFQSINAREKAIDSYAKAFGINPGLVEALYNTGVLYYEQKDWKEAIEHFKKALDRKPDFEAAAFNLAAAHRENGSFEEAAEMYLYATHLNQQLVMAHHNRALCLQRIGKHTQAISAFQRAIALEPDNAIHWFHLAESFFKIQSIDDALASLQQAAKLKPDWDRALYNLAIVLRSKERLADAIRHIQRVLELNPRFEDAQVYLFRLAQHACDWPLAAKAAARIDTLTAQQLEKGIKTAEIPMVSLRRHADPMRNLTVARSWSRHIAQEIVHLPDRPIFRHSRNLTSRLRVGYLSSDFKDHAVAHQIRGMLAAHNRQEFEIFGYMANPDDGTRYRQLLIEACDRTRDIHDLSPLAAARNIYEDGIHILVEMSGYSKDSLMPIASMRPAPLQISYLGFLGSTGADCIDYTLADLVVVPPEHTTHYSEKVIHLPHCYQANDDMQAISNRSVDRKDYNLPLDSFVYCSFNQPYKIDANLFDIWMRILKNVNSSVLWLIERSPLATDNLKQAAVKAGVDPARLVFTGFVPLEENLARLRLADLVLDTLQYNGGATTSNALWAGVPVLTVLGTHWVSRMTASALRAIGLPELISPDRQTYEHIAIDLANHPGKMTALRRKLSIQRQCAPLFDTRLFTQHVEFAFRHIWKQYATGIKPRSFAVPPLKSSKHADAIHPQKLR
jgi:protein O-GlcNAc transferase